MQESDLEGHRDCDSVLVIANAECSVCDSMNVVSFHASGISYQTVVCEKSCKSSNQEEFASSSCS